MRARPVKRQIRHPPKRINRLFPQNPTGTRSGPLGKATGTSLTGSALRIGVSARRRCWSGFYLPRCFWVLTWLCVEAECCFFAGGLRR
jgi:hypothetical protein